MVKRTQQQIIAGLMPPDPINEEWGAAGLGGTSVGSAMGPSIGSSSNLGDGEALVVMQSGEEECEGGYCEDGDTNFTEQHLRLAKRFIELMGGADRAREVLDKVDDCEDCLGLIDDNQSAADSDSAAIEKMAGMLPNLPDLPMALSNLYNPGAGGPAY